ncbi:hypothetical protein BSZ35_04230 [Salinibacter sp. 10B]|nr:FHA domain-containing protein [Salinibacter sp. 10B]PQJ33918.1 hypothetical protein BSZ35_04230 [Salinibacter sp. 10B]
MEEGEHVPSQEYVFRKDRISIGRGRKRHLMLPAPWVRSTHAIVDRAWGGYRLLVSGWDEITFLNGERIVDEQPCPLREGDVLRIGPFCIEVQFPDRQRKGNSKERKNENPFDESVDELLKALTSVSEAYVRTSALVRDDALKEALSSVPERILAHPGVQKTLEGLQEKRTPPNGNASSETTRPRSEEEHAPSIGHHTQAGNDVRVRSDVFRVLTEALATMLELPARFRYEFIGHPLTHPPRTRFLYEGSGLKIRQRLTDATMSVRERTRHLCYVEEAADAVARHHVAVIRGYKTSIMTGMKEVLQQIDPDVHEQPGGDGHPILDRLPMLSSARVLERVREACHDLLQDDWSVAEQQVFRPAFARAYLAHMTSPHTPNDGAGRLNAES